MLCAEEAYCQERAAFVVSELAAEYSWKVLLQRGAAIEQLVPVLASPDPDIKVPHLFQRLQGRSMHVT